MEKDERFVIAGAGDLVIGASQGSCQHCGGSYGVGVAVSWGDHAEAGGVMDVKEVKRLIKLLNEWVESHPEGYFEQARKAWAEQRKEAKKRMMELEDNMDGEKSPLEIQGETIRRNEALRKHKFERKEDES